MADVESFTNNISSMDLEDLREEAVKTISEFIPDECFLNTFLNSNLTFKLEDTDKEYQVDIKILKVSDSDNYRFVCNPHGIGPGKYENGYFLKVDDSNKLILSNQPLYLINTELNVET